MVAPAIHKVQHTMACHATYCQLQLSELVPKCTQLMAVAMELCSASKLCLSCYAKLWQLQLRCSL
jgi:hypothetical protein